MRVVVNDVLVHDAGADLGGLNKSSISREQGDAALRAMCTERHVNVERFPGATRRPFGFPYTPQDLRWIDRTTDALFSPRPLAALAKRLLLPLFRAL